MAKFKQRCVRCKKNMVLMHSSKQSPICVECEMKYVGEPIEDPIFKKMFDIPREFYLENYFLRSIRVNYVRHRSLSKAQVEAFEKAVKEIKGGKKRGRVEKGTK